MTPLQYLDSLIAGHQNSSIPIQLSELELLRQFIQADNTARVQAGWQAAVQCHASHGTAGWSIHRDQYLSHAASDSSFLAPDLNATRDMLRQYCNGWGSIAGFGYAMSHLEQAMQMLGIKVKP